MSQQHPVTPLPELVYRLRDEAPYGNLDGGTKRELHLIDAAYQAGADQELEACLGHLLRCGFSDADILRLRTARRPKPPSLEGALRVLKNLIETRRIVDPEYQALRQALEALPND